MKKRTINKQLFLPLLVSVLLCCAPTSAHAQTVSVMLPDFPITLNGTTIDNDHRQYPLLIYRDITYFPLTYHDTRFLGIESTWDDTTQTLSIARSDISGGYQSATQNNAKRYNATICDFPVVVNDQTIDNSKEPYPLITFRDVTYFPMTWAYGVDAFDWQYDFDEQNGLVITCAYPRPTMIDLKGLALLDDDTDNAHYNVQLIGGYHYDYFYYEGEDGIIYQTPLDRPDQPKQIFQLPLNAHGDGARVSASLGKQDGQLTLTFHQSGATMGHDETWLFATDGSAQQLPIMSPFTYLLKDGDRTIGHTVDPTDPYYTGYTDDLFLIEDDNFHTIGRDSVHYFGALTVIGQKVFVLGDEAGRTDLYVIDLDTDQTHRINDDSWQPEQLLSAYSYPNSHYIYFLGGKKDTDDRWTEYGLYRLLEPEYAPEPRSTDIEFIVPLVPENPLFTFLGDAIYYGIGTSEQQQLYKLGETEPINANGKLTALFTDDDDHVVAVFDDMNEQNDTRLLLIDLYDTVVFRSADKVQNVQSDRGHLFYLLPDGQGCLFTIYY